MSTFQERYEKTKQVVLSPNVTTREALRHLYLFMRFEQTIQKRNKAQRKALLLNKKLDENLEIFMLREEMDMIQL